MYPSGDFLKRMKEALFIKDDIVSSYENGNSSLCAQDVDNLKNWSPGEDLVREYELHDEGYQEIMKLAQRLKKAFPKLFELLDAKDYTFRSVNEEIAENSMKGFIAGLGKLNISVDSPWVAYDNLISRDQIQKRLGINYSLSNTNVMGMWDFCRYMTAGIDKKMSPWCALFSTEDLKVMEYVDDIREYFRNGYGNPTNKLFGEIAIAELLKSFREVIAGNGKKIAAYVTRASTTEMIFSALGLFNDRILSTTSQKYDRKWMTSKFAGFASNFIAVLNK
ncbi:multiple inositol polyphosphate phosphatase 1-like [Anticarsia gemmatalis]|uniref:multiple inositol polyphosphate phosphatase 1-like n=1 Tax=Anticarsia gemmatalis TaxID=129554 RepID=UPI003F76625A